MIPRPSARPAAGFTLVELMIVIAVIAMLAAAAGPALGALTGADARKAAGELAGTMRWLFDSASVRHATCRLVLDTGERAFWAECAPGRTAIDRPGDARARRDRPARDAEGAAEGQAPNGFAAFDDPIVRRRELPGSVHFQSIRIDGRELGDDEGQGLVHFFPGGRAQSARVTVADGGHVYSIRLEPFTGRARVSAGVPREEGR